jgi:hypothetical protein
MRTIYLLESSCFRFFVVHFDIALLGNGFNHLNQLVGLSEGLKPVGFAIINLLQKSRDPTPLLRRQF